MLLLLINVIHALLHYQFSLGYVLVHRNMPHFIEFFFYVFIVWLILVPQILQIVKESFDLLKPLHYVWKQVLLRIFECLLFQLLYLILMLVYFRPSKYPKSTYFITTAAVHPKIQ